MLAGRALIVVVVILLSHNQFAQSQTPGQKSIDFQRDVYPIFERSCFACHGGEQQMGKLRLDTRAAVFQGGVSGNTVVPHRSDRSELYRRVAGIGDQAIKGRQSTVRAYRVLA